MTQTIEFLSRDQVIRFLPDAIHTAIISYQTFSQKGFEDDPKAFKDHHSACKIAIAHIELLLKLARWADLPDSKTGSINDQVVLAAMMQEAQDVLREYRDEEGGDE